MDWRRILFGWPAAGAKPEAEPVSPSGGNGAEEIFSHAPEKELRSSTQHKYLFDEGVLHWNQRKHHEKFKPNFAGVNFVKEAQKSRIFGRPADLVGEERVALAGVDFANADLQACSFVRADLRNAQLQGADLRNANLAGALLNGADLRAADLRGANLDGAQLARARLQHANLAGASCKGANFAWVDLRHTIVGARTLAEANLFGAVRDFDRARFERRIPPPPPQPQMWGMPQIRGPQAQPSAPAVEGQIV